MTFRSAGVAPEVNLMNPLHTSKETRKRGIPPDFETHNGSHQKSKTGISVALQKCWCPPKMLKKIWLSFCQGMNSNLNECIMYTILVQTPCFDLHIIIHLLWLKTVFGWKVTIQYCHCTIGHTMKWVLLVDWQEWFCHWFCCSTFRKIDT